jgi:hypothetical protein
LVDVWSASQQVWAPGFVQQIDNDDMLHIKYGLYDKVIAANSSKLRSRTSLDRRYEIGDLVEVFEPGKKKWYSGVVVERNIDKDLAVIVKYNGPSGTRKKRRVPRNRLNLRPLGFIEPPTKPKKKFLDCKDLSNMAWRKWKLNEGASHFKKVNFKTG